MLGLLDRTVLLPRLLINVVNMIEIEGSASLVVHGVVLTEAGELVVGLGVTAGVVVFDAACKGAIVARPLRMLVEETHHRSIVAMSVTPRVLTSSKTTAKQVTR